MIKNDIQKEMIYYSRSGNTARYSVSKPGGTEVVWEIDSTHILPYVFRWPELLQPQTIH